MGSILDKVKKPKPLKQSVNFRWPSEVVAALHEYVETKTAEAEANGEKTHGLLNRISAELMAEILDQKTGGKPPHE